MFHVFFFLLLTPVSSIVLQSVSNVRAFFTNSKEADYRSASSLSLNLSLSQYEHSLFHSLSQQGKKIDICLVLDGMECFCLYGVESIFSFIFPLHSLSSPSRCGFSEDFNEEPEVSHLSEDDSRVRRVNPSHYLSLSVYYDNQQPSLVNHDSDHRLVIASSPLFLTSSYSHQQNHRKVTLVLTLAFSDVSRAMILLDSLRILSAVTVSETRTNNWSSKVPLSSSTVYEMLIIVPDSQEDLLKIALIGFQEVLPFAVRFVSEKYLFRRSVEKRKNQDPYATQMACKLLIAKYVETDYYLTLDADHILLHPLKLSKLFDGSLLSEPERLERNDGAAATDVGYPDLSGPLYSAFPSSEIVLPAVYHYEEYGIHSFWWDGSRKLLNADQIPPGRLAFGVTPVVLSRWGSLMTLSLLEKSLRKKLSSFPEADSSPNPPSCEMFGLDMECAPFVKARRQLFNDENVEAYWLESLGKPDPFEKDGSLVIWTEYTLYKTAFEIYQVNYFFSCFASFSCRSVFMMFFLFSFVRFSMSCIFLNLLVLIIFIVIMFGFLPNFPGVIKKLQRIILVYFPLFNRLQVYQ
jgi:hypothetical protein